MCASTRRASFRKGSTSRINKGPLLNQHLANDCQVKNNFRILIADRNRHVREFLQREFATEGYQCELAANGQDLESRLKTPHHLLILDSEIFLIEGWHLLELWATNKPRVPLIIHTFVGESYNHPFLALADAVVEKKGDPESLMCAVRDVLARYYPENRIVVEAPGSGFSIHSQ